MIEVGIVDRMDPEKYDENWMIVRAPDSIPSYAHHVPQLSPQPDLFRRYRAVYEAGQYTYEWFRNEYVPQFLQDLAVNEEALQLLEDLCHTEKKIYLCCYCREERTCHRSIIAGLLLGMGAQIQTDPEYLEYYRMFRRIPGSKVQDDKEERKV